MKPVSNRRLRTLFALPLLVILGCGGVQRTTRENATKEITQSPDAEDSPVFLGSSVEGRPIVAWHFGEGGETTLFIGVVHGNEPGGKPLLQHLCWFLRAHPEILEDKTVVVIPVANPDGLARGTRYNAHNIDINRNFPTGNWAKNRRKKDKTRGPASEPETMAIMKALREFRPSKIITVHSAANCIDYDGPARDLARLMAQNALYSIRRLGTLPGSLGSYAGAQLDIPIVTVELDRKYSEHEGRLLWRRMGPALLAAIDWQPGDHSQAR